MKVLFFIVLCYIFSHYLAFIVLCIPLRILNQRSRLAFLADRKEGVFSGTANLVSLENVSGKGLVKSFAKIVKTKVFCLIYSYSRYLVHTIKYFPSHTVRNIVYKHVFLVDRHPDSVIYFGCEIRAGYCLHIGRGSIIGDNCILDARQGIYIGENVNLSSEVHLWTESHDMNDPYFRSMPNKRGAIHIGNHAWLGSNVTVLDNVSIGEGAVVCAGAVVTKDVEPFAVVAGVPAKKISERSHDLKYKFDGSHVLFY